MNLKKFLSKQIFPYFNELFTYDDEKKMLLVVSHNRFNCDYQINAFLDKNRYSKVNQFIDNLKKANLPFLEKIELVGNGFLNLTISTKWLIEQSNELVNSEKTLQADKTKIIVDYSSPNVAKEMSVHHMRSTFLGDSIARVLEYKGFKVIRANHIGDWGAQFGLIIAWIEKFNIDIDELKLSELEEIYCSAKIEQKKSLEFDKLAKKKVKLLQNGDRNTVLIWEKCVQLTVDSIQNIYDTFNVTLKTRDIKGESYYREESEVIIKELLEKGLAIVKDGSIISYVEDSKNRTGDEMAIVWKTRDGAALYSLTDLACAKYRAIVSDRAIYCTDARQSLHFKQVWALSKKFGLVPVDFRFDHMSFGMMLGKNGLPYKTRDGGTPKLLDLLQDSKKIALNILSNKLSNFSEIEKEFFIHAIAVNSIKYADLCRNRETNYIFDQEQSLQLDGNSAPYLMYALVRANSIIKKSKSYTCKTISIEDSLSKEEKEIWVKIYQFDEVLEEVIEKCLPHLLCKYLYSLASIFSLFYEKNTILLNDKTFRLHHIKLVEMISHRLNKGMNLLGFILLDNM